MSDMSGANSTNKKQKIAEVVTIDGKDYTIKAPVIQDLPERDRVHLDLNLREDGSLDMKECNDEEAGRKMYERVYSLFMEEVESIPEGHFVGHQLQLGVDEDKVEPFDIFIQSLKDDNNDNPEMRQEFINEFQRLLNTYPLMYMISCQPNFENMMRYICKNLINYATAVNMQLADQGLDFNIAMTTGVELETGTEDEKVEDEIPRLFEFITLILQTLYVAMNPEAAKEIN